MENVVDGGGVVALRSVPWRTSLRRMKCMSLALPGIATLVAVALHAEGRRPPGPGEQARGRIAGKATGWRGEQRRRFASGVDWNPGSATGCTLPKARPSDGSRGVSVTTLKIRVWNSPTWRRPGAVIRGGNASNLNLVGDQWAMTTISYFDDEKLITRPIRCWSSSAGRKPGACGAPREKARAICESAAAFFIAASS